MKQDKISRYSKEYLKGFQDAFDMISSCIYSQRDIFGRSIIPKEILQDIDDQIHRKCIDKFGEKKQF